MPTINATTNQRFFAIKPGFNEAEQAVYFNIIRALLDDESGNVSHMTKKITLYLVDDIYKQEETQEYKETGLKVNSLFRDIPDFAFLFYYEEFLNFYLPAVKSYGYELKDPLVMVTKGFDKLIKGWEFQRIHLHYDADRLGVTYRKVLNTIYGKKL